MTGRDITTILMVLSFLTGCTDPPAAKGRDAASETPAPDRDLRDTTSEAHDSGEAWITISPNNRYFQFEDGRPFFPVGLSMHGELINLDYYGNVTLDGLSHTFPADNFEQLLIKMKENGANLLRIDIEGLGYWSYEETEALLEAGKMQFFENPAGVINETYAQRVDRLIALAEQYSVYIDLVLVLHTCGHDVGSAKNRFSLYPYHEAQGGPVTQLKELITDPSARELLRKRFKAIVDRWGGSLNIFALELWNELMNCYTSDLDAQLVAQWIEKIGGELRDYQIATYGKAHLIHVSSVEIEPEEDFFYVSPGLDLVTTHYYTETQATNNPVLIAKEVHQKIPALLERINYARPHYENEHCFMGNETGRDSEHYLAWAYLASGSAAGGAAWVMMGQPPLADFRTAEVAFSTSKAMTEIIGGIDLANFSSRPWGEHVTGSNDQVQSMVISDQKTTIGWLFHDNEIDYEIEMVQSWVASSPSPNDFVTNAFHLHKWYKILLKDEVPVDLSSYIQRIAVILVEAFGVPEDVASNLAQVALSNPVEFQQMIGPHLEKLPAATRQQVIGALNQVLVDMYMHFTELEEAHHALDDLYTAHPQVETTLTIQSLTNSNHEVRWYDDSTGSLVKKESHSGSTLHLQSPPFSKHIAFVIGD